MTGREYLSQASKQQRGTGVDTPEDPATEAPALKAAGVFWRNWRIWPTLLIAVLVIWVFGWLYIGALWGLEVYKRNAYNQY